jgi:urease accessory protein
MTSAGFLSGFAHACTGLDHLVTMVAVGIWAARLGQRALWLLPLTFTLGITLGGLPGLNGQVIDALEAGVSGSAIVLGTAVLFRPQATLLAAVMFGGFAAVLHGHAHVAAMPAGSGTIPYIAGLVSATAVLQTCGIAVVILASTRALVLRRKTA